MRHLLFRGCCANRRPIACPGEKVDPRGPEEFARLLLSDPALLDEELRQLLSRCTRDLVTQRAPRFVAGLDPDAQEARFVRPAASMTFMGPVATTRVIMKPLFVSSARNSCSVRSDPPRPRSMLRSLRTVARCSALGSDTSGMIRSTSSSLPGGPSARRQFARILTLRSASQSWITLFKINA